VRSKNIPGVFGALRVCSEDIRKLFRTLRVSSEDIRGLFATHHPCLEDNIGLFGIPPIPHRSTGPGSSRLGVGSGAYKPTPEKFTATKP
jgi:hypothetical protein